MVINYFKLMQLLTALHNSINNINHYLHSITASESITQDQRQYLLDICDLVTDCCKIGEDTQRRFLYTDTKTDTKQEEEHVNH
jgi:hypothetical protein